MEQGQSVQAKVRCIGNSAPQWGGTANDSMRTVRFAPVYDPDPASRNFEWSSATPSGYIELNITNRAAFEAFQANEEYLLTFEKAP